VDAVTSSRQRLAEVKHEVKPRVVIFTQEQHQTVPSKKPAPCSLRSQFGRNVTQFRTAKGLTQEGLAEAVALSVRYTQSLEAGEYFPSLPTLVKLRKTLGVSWDDLFRGCGNS